MSCTARSPRSSTPTTGSSPSRASQWIGRQGCAIGPSNRRRRSERHWRAKRPSPRSRSGGTSRPRPMMPRVASRLQRSAIAATCPRTCRGSNGSSSPPASNAPVAAATAQDRRGPHRAARHRARTTARSGHRAASVCLPRLHGWRHAGRAIVRHWFKHNGERACGADRERAADRGRHRPRPVEPSTRTTCRCIARPRCSPGRASASTAARSRTGVKTGREAIDLSSGQVEGMNARSAGSRRRLPPAARRRATGRTSEELRASLHGWSGGDRGRRCGRVSPEGRGTGSRSWAGPDQDRLPLGPGPRRARLGRQ